MDNFLETLRKFDFFSYDGKLADENCFIEAINEGFKSDDFKSLVTWLVNEISELSKMEEKVSFAARLYRIVKFSSRNEFPDNAKL